MAAVTERDMEATRLAYRLKYVTIDHLQTCVYSNRNVAQRRGAAIEKEGFFRSFPLLTGKKGQSNKVYYINAARRRSIEQMLAEQLDAGNIPKTPPENALVARHFVELNTVLTAFIAGARQSGCFLDFIPEYWSSARSTGSVLADKVRNPANPRRMVEYRRDAVIWIGNGRGQKALFEVEYDRGKEAVRGGRFRKVTLAGKIAIFLQSLKERRFERFARPEYFGYRFLTSRLILITASSQTRLRHIVAACNEINTHGLVYLTTIDRIRPDTVFGPIWTVPDNGEVFTRKLVGRK